MKLKIGKLFKRKSNKANREKKNRPAIPAPKKRSPVVNTLLFSLKVLWGALRLILTILILAGFIGGGLVAGLVYGYIETTPALSASDLEIKKYNTFIYDKDGNVLAELKQYENRVWIDYAEIPQNLINAFIAVEDKRFWQHNGVDYRRFVKSAFVSAISYLKDEDTLQGGSTITQQMIKNLTGNNKNTIKRKIQEAWQALKVEREGLSKEDILTRYLNTIPMGSTVYGIETAAQAYYGKDVRNLSLAECASMAGITNWPTKYIPNSEDNKTNNVERAHYILDLMLQQGMITEEEHAQAIQEEIKFTFNPGAGKVTRTSVQSYFVEEVIKTVIKDLSEQKGISTQTAEDLVYNSGLKIYTTLEKRVQDALDGVYTDDTYFPRINEEANLREEIPQSAMVIIDPATGAVRGLYGGYGKKEGSVLNRATNIARSPGSTIKPLLIYAPGIETGRITAATVIDDVPQHMLLNDLSVPEKERQQIYPRNVEKKNFGLTTVRMGLVESRNVVASLILRDFTTFKVGLSYLEKLNLPRWENDGMISMAMGGFSKGMSPLQMASAYTVFAYKGVYWEPYFYTTVEDYEGNTMLENTPKATKIFSEQTAFIMNDILQQAVLEGTGEGNLVFNKDGEAIPTAGKTGTADRSIDKWFCGATPYYVGATWYGYDNSKAQISLTSAETNNAKKIWHAVMTKIHEELEPTPFFSSTPAKIVTRKICMDSGKLATSLCEQDPRGSRVVEEYFIDGTEPDYGDNCEVHFMAKVCSATADEFGRPVLASEYCPAETVTQQIRIRRPVSYTPMFPTDPYPEDWKYGIDENRHCLVHSQPAESFVTPMPTPPITIPATTPPPTPEPTPTYNPFTPY